MNKIKHVTIEKLWGTKTISTNFHDTVNIFIGANGSHKTTFIQLIEAVLLVDINVLSDIYFEKINIQFYKDDLDYLTVTKNESNDSESTMLKYEFRNEESFEVPCNEIILHRSYRLMSRYRETHLELKKKLSGLINVSWLSVNRDNSLDRNIDRREDREKLKNSVDIKLQELANGLMYYQLQLESETSRLADKFKADVLSLMLYDPSIDYFAPQHLDKFEFVDPSQMKRALFQAFNSLGVLRDSDKMGSIILHTEKLR